MSALPPILESGRRRSIAALIALALSQAVATGVAAFATRDVFSTLGDPSAAAAPFVALALIGLAGCAIATLRFFERTVAERLGQDYAAAVRVAIFRHLSRVSARSLAERRAGALAMRFVGDLTAVRGWVSLGLARLVSASVVLPACGVVLVLLNADLAAAAAVPIVIGLALMLLAGPRLGPAHRRLRARRTRLAADMSERIPHAPELRLLGRMDIELAQLARRTEKLIDSALDRARGVALLRAVPDVVAGVTAASVFFIAFTSGAPVAEAAGAMAAVGLMVQQMRELAGVWDRRRAWTVAREKCEELLAAPTVSRTRRHSGEALADGPLPLCFAGVGAHALKEVDIVAAAGRKIAVVGGNGAGKSTLLALAAGLERPERGTVTLGERATSGLDANDRRRLITFVTGRSPILAGSLRRALTMGTADRLEDATILEAAATFGLDAVVNRLGGLDGKISEAGRNLSAGEARRVLLARAALSQPRLLLLDEPDDALDSGARELVERLVRDCDATALIVTHDLALARLMDEIWLLDDGHLVDVRTPASLLDGNGPAARYLAPRSAA